MHRDAERFGLGADKVVLLAGHRQGDAGVWPENWPIVAAFLAVATQWRAVSVGGGLAPARTVVIGLDYASARVALEILRVDLTPELWAGLQIMEVEAIRALNGTQ